MATGGTIIKEIAFFGHIFLATGGSALKKIILAPRDRDIAGALWSHVTLV
jgi:hypothetical protein